MMSNEREFRPSNRDLRALDRALDNRARGRSVKATGLHSGMNSTVERVFDLAAIGGMTGDVQSKRRTGLLRFPPKQWISIGSTIAAILILAIALNATVPALRNQNNGALGTVVGTPEAESPERYDVAALTPEDCTAKPRTREELLDILSTAPGQSMIPDMDFTVSENEEELIRELEATMREWQACLRFNQSFAALAYESEEFIRMKVYPDPYVVEPYSVATLNEILDGYESTDKQYGASTPAPVEEDFWAVLQVDKSKAISNVAVGSQMDVYVRLVSPQTGFNVEWGYVTFIQEDGQWRIAYTQLDIVSQIRYEPQP